MVRCENNPEPSHQTEKIGSKSSVYAHTRKKKIRKKKKEGNTQAPLPPPRVSPKLTHTGPVWIGGVKKVSGLTRKEAARMAAVLPNPKRFSVRTPSGYMRQRTREIERQMNNLGSLHLKHL
jgi:hypothetical protein